MGHLRLWRLPLMLALVGALLSSQAAAGLAATTAARPLANASSTASTSSNARPTPANPAVAAIERLRFSSLITSLSAGPAVGDLALTFADGSGSVLVHGAVTLRLSAPVTLLAWVPGSEWVLYETAGGYYLRRAAGGAPTALPACAAGAMDGAPQVLRRAVAWWCGGRIKVWRLPPATAAPLSPAGVVAYSVPERPLPAAGSFAVGPDALLVAVHYAAGTKVFRLSDGAAVSTRWARGNPPVLLSWSPDGVLALADTGGAGGVFLLTEIFTNSLLYSQSQQTFAADTDVRWLQWLPDGSGVLALDVLNPGSTVPVYALDRLDWDGSSARLMQGRLGYVLGLSAAGSLLWREEGVGSDVYGGGAVAAGPGPFSLRAVPIPLRLPSPEQALPILASMRMVSATTGWALATMPGYTTPTRILLTTDAGRTWRDATPYGYDAGPYPGDPLDDLSVNVGPGGPGAPPGCTAWAPPTCDMLWTVGAVVDPAGYDRVVLLRSEDGGLNWTALPPHGLTVPQLASPGGDLWQGGPFFTFDSPTQGWAVVYGGTQAFIDNVFRTDVGNAWVKVGTITLDKGLPGGPPPDGLPERLYFHDAMHGWFVGQATDFAWLYATSDGGRTWRNVRLPVPPSDRYAQVTTEVPVFFDATSGVLPVVFTKPQASGATTQILDLYVTSNGGATWTPTAPVAAQPPRDFGGTVDWDVLDARHAWVLDGDVIHVTSDGGARWTTGRPNMALTGVTSFDFATAQVGWLATDVAGSEYGTLWRTTNGGRTWLPWPGRMVCATPVEPPIGPYAC